MHTLRNDTSTRPGYRLVVAEDEAIIRSDIEHTLRSLGHHVVGGCATGEQAIALCAEHRPDVVLMDVKLRDGSCGIEAAREIHASTGTPLIFLTANSDLSTINKARTTLPYGFITKPFRAVELKTNIDLAVSRRSNELHRRSERLRLQAALNGGDREALFVKCDGRRIAVRYSTIEYVEAMKDYVAIHTGGKRYVTLSTMNAMASRLPAADFLRVHRSFVVRLDRVKSIGQEEVIMEREGLRIPIGDTYRSGLARNLSLM